MTTADEAQRVRTRSRPSLAGMRPDRWSLLALPAVVFLVLFFLVPLVAMSVRSVTDPADAGLSNYQKFFEQAAYVRVLTNTFWIAVLATVASLVIGYPFAYLMSIVPGRWAGPAAHRGPAAVLVEPAGPYVRVAGPAARHRRHQPASCSTSA